MVLFLAVVAGGVGIVRWYAYSTYYFGNNNGAVAVYQGQPQGVLWFKPKIVRTTKFLVKDLQPGDQQDLAATISEASVSEAMTEAKYLHRLWKMGQTPTTTTTKPTATSTTSPPPTTTTTKPVKKKAISTTTSTSTTTTNHDHDHHNHRAVCYHHLGHHHDDLVASEPQPGEKDGENLSGDATFHLGCCYLAITRSMAKA